MIYLAADHGGFELKKHLLEFLKVDGYEVSDLGNSEFDPADDYPDFAIKAIRKVLENPTENKAVLACRSGTGEVILANRFHGIHATNSSSVQHAKMSREHNDTNVLALPADYVDQKTAEEIVSVWLSTKFSGDERYVRRLKKIEDFSERKAQ